MPGSWRRRSTYVGRSTPYRRNIDWVTQTQACQQYGLKSADLAAISPIEEVQNPHGGRHPMKKLARSQVEYLVRQLEHEKSLSVEIVRTRAMNEYNLSLDQMYTLVPIRTAPNAYNSGTEMRFYNVKDVCKLAEKVKVANEVAAAHIAAQQVGQIAQTSDAGLRSPSRTSSAVTGPNSSQTSFHSEQTMEADEDEFGDGGFDDSILLQIELPSA